MTLELQNILNNYTYFILFLKSKRYITESTPHKTAFTDLWPSTVYHYTHSSAVPHHSSGLYHNPLQPSILKMPKCQGGLTSPDTTKPQSRCHALNRKDTCHSEIFSKGKRHSWGGQHPHLNLSRRREFPGEKFSALSINSLATNKNNKEDLGERKHTLARVQVNKWQGSSGRKRPLTELPAMLSGRWPC